MACLPPFDRRPTALVTTDDGRTLSTVERGTASSRPCSALAGTRRPRRGCSGSAAEPCTAASSELELGATIPGAAGAARSTGPPSGTTAMASATMEPTAVDVRAARGRQEVAMARRPAPRSRRSGRPPSSSSTTSRRSRDLTVVRLTRGPPPVVGGRCRRGDWDSRGRGRAGGGPRPADARPRRPLAGRADPPAIARDRDRDGHRRARRVVGHVEPAVWRGRLPRETVQPRPTLRSHRPGPRVAHRGRRGTAAERAETMAAEADRGLLDLGRRLAALEIASLDTLDAALAALSAQPARVARARAARDQKSRRQSPR